MDDKLDKLMKMLQDSETRMSQEMQAIKGAVDDIKPELSSLQGSVSRLQPEIDGLKATFEAWRHEMESKDGDLGSAVSELRRQVSHIVKGVGAGALGPPPGAAPPPVGTSPSGSPSFGVHSRPDGHRRAVPHSTFSLPPTPVTGQNKSLSMIPSAPNSSQLHDIVVSKPVSASGNPPPQAEFPKFGCESGKPTLPWDPGEQENVFIYAKLKVSSRSARGTRKSMFLKLLELMQSLLLQHSSSLSQASVNVKDTIETKASAHDTCKNNQPGYARTLDCLLGTSNLSIPCFAELHFHWTEAMVRHLYCGFTIRSWFNTECASFLVSEYYQWASAKLYHSPIFDWEILWLCDLKYSKGGNMFRQPFSVDILPEQYHWQIAWSSLVLVLYSAVVIRRKNILLGECFPGSIYGLDISSINTPSQTSRVGLQVGTALIFWAPVDLNGKTNQHWRIPWDPGGYIFALCSSRKWWTSPKLTHLYCSENLQCSSVSFVGASRICLVAWDVDDPEFSAGCSQAPFQGGRNVMNRAAFFDEVHVGHDYYTSRSPSATTPTSMKHTTTTQSTMASSASAKTASGTPASSRKFTYHGISAS